MKKSNFVKKEKIKKLYLDAGNMVFAKGGPKNQFFYVDRFFDNSTCL